jgi:hypothetical protein
MKPHLLNRSQIFIFPYRLRDNHMKPNGFHSEQRGGKTTQRLSIIPSVQVVYQSQLGETDVRRSSQADLEDQL